MLYMCKAFNTHYGGWVLSQWQLFCDSNDHKYIIIPLLCQVRHVSGDFSRNLPPRMLKSQLSLFTRRAQLLWFTNYRTHDRGTTCKCFWSNVPDPKSSPCPSSSAEPSWPEKQSAPTKVEGPASQHCWKCWLYVGTTAEETRLFLWCTTAWKNHMQWIWLVICGSNPRNCLANGLKRREAWPDSWGWQKDNYKRVTTPLERTLLSAIFYEDPLHTEEWLLMATSISPRSCHLIMADFWYWLNWAHQGLSPETTDRAMEPG